MRALLPLLVALALLAPGCGRRERANPFDPFNPETSGRPSGFVALAGDREVGMRWQAVPGGAPVGFQLFRRGPGETEYTPLTDVLSPTTTGFRDFPLVNGGDYAYRLYYVFPFGLGHLPAEDSATPGTAAPWVIESGGTDLVRLTPDNRRVASRRGGYSRTADVAANAANGDVWVADDGNGRVVINQATGVTVSVGGLQRPVAVGIDPVTATAWVCDLGRDRVYQLRRDGTIHSLSIGPVDQPVDAAVDAFNGFVWVCELAGNRVLQFDDFGQFQWAATVSRPSRVAVDSVTRDGWITSFDRGTVTRIAVNGQVVGTFTGFTAPLGVAVDWRRGRVWVADPYADRVTALRPDGSEEFRVTGLRDVGEIAVDLRTGEAWAVLGITGAVARISPAGVVLRFQAGLRSPIAVSVDPGGR